MSGEASALVVDASVVVKWHLPDEELADVAVLVLRRFGAGTLELYAPAQIRFEVPAAITIAAGGRAPRITAEQCREAVEEFLALELTTVDRDELILAALPLVHRYGIAFSDALYLALAQDLGIPLITADRRLYERLRGLPHLLGLGTYGRHAAAGDSDAAPART